MSLLLGPLSRREVPPYLLDRRLGGPHSSSGRCEETETCAFTGNRTPVCRPAPKALKGNGFSLHEIGVRGSRGIAPLFLDVCTTCICVVSFALRLFYPLAQRSRCPLSRKVDKSTTCQSITQHFILYTIKIVYCQGDMFRPYKVILRPSKKTDPRAVLCFIASHNAVKIFTFTSVQLQQQGHRISVTKLDV